MEQAFSRSMYGHSAQSHEWPMNPLLFSFAGIIGVLIQHFSMQTLLDDLNDDCNNSCKGDYAITDSDL